MRQRERTLTISPVRRTNRERVWAPTSSERTKASRKTKERPYVVVARCTVSSYLHVWQWWVHAARLRRRDAGDCEGTRLHEHWDLRGCGCVVCCGGRSIRRSTFHSTFCAAAPPDKEWSPPRPPPPRAALSSALRALPSAVLRVPEKIANLFGFVKH